jgi:hypothetical protein
MLFNTLWNMSLGLPANLTWYKFLTDWGSLVGGGAALLAGLIAYVEPPRDSRRLFDLSYAAISVASCIA